MSTTSRRPVKPAPGDPKWPRLGYPSAAVTSGATHAGSASPVSQFRPVGRSTASSLESGFVDLVSWESVFQDGLQRAGNGSCAPCTQDGVDDHMGRA